ncbi:MAG: hypothetical protein VB027_07630 [Gordonibacter sp.]|nr:hypothetical protein [Gordonibacter sp.]
MASKFDLRKFLDEFVRYANTVIPYDEQFGTFTIELHFSVLNGRLTCVLTALDAAFTDYSFYCSEVWSLLFLTIDTLNRNQGFCNLSKNRTFVLSVDKDRGGLAYGSVGV